MGEKVKIKQYIKDVLDGKDNSLSYEKECYMNNNYPSWKYYKNSIGYLDDTYMYVL